jgi:hypothetical protein
MSRSLFAALTVVAAAGLAAWIDNRLAVVHSNPAGSPSAPIAIAASPVVPAASAPRAPASPMTAEPFIEEETSLMQYLRRADPATMLALARDGNRRYPGSANAEEREARAIDALVALDDIGEAHTEAMLFVQHHPTGPFTTHVANLMGVHPRPPGAVPELPARAEGR